MSGVMFNKILKLNKMVKNSVIMLLITLLVFGSFMRLDYEVVQAAEGEVESYGIVIAVNEAGNSGKISVSIDSSDNKQTVDDEYKKCITAEYEEGEGKNKNLILEINKLNFSTNYSTAISIVDNTNNVNNVYIYYKDVNNISSVAKSGESNAEEVYFGIKGSAKNKIFIQSMDLSSSLNIECNRYNGVGIYSNNELELDTGIYNITANGQKGSCIKSSGYIEINGGIYTLNSKGESGVGIYSNTNININDSKKLVVNGGIGGEAYGIYGKESVNINSGSIELAVTAMGDKQAAVIKTDTTSATSVINILGGSLKTTINSENTTDANSGALVSNKVNITGGDIDINIAGNYVKGINAGVNGITIGDNNNEDGKSPDIDVIGNIQGLATVEDSDLKTNDEKKSAVYTSGDIILNDGRLNVDVSNKTSYDYICGVSATNIIVNNGTLQSYIDAQGLTKKADSIVASTYTMNDGTVEASVKVVGSTRTGRGLYVSGDMIYEGGIMILQGEGRALQFGNKDTSGNLDISILDSEEDHRHVTVASKFYNGANPDSMYDKTHLEEYKYLKIEKQYIGYLVFKKKGDSAEYAIYRTYNNEQGQETEVLFQNDAISIWGTTITLNNFNYTSTKEYGLKIEASEDVTINCTAGTVNKIVADEDIEGVSYAIHSNTNVNITGTGKLDIQVDNNFQTIDSSQKVIESGLGYGIYLEDGKTLTNSEATLNVNGAGSGDIGVRTSKDITVYSGITTIQGKDRVVEYISKTDSDQVFICNNNLYIAKVSENYDGSEASNNYDATKINNYKYIQTGKVESNYYEYKVSNKQLYYNSDEVSQPNGLKIELFGKNLKITLDNFNFTTSGQYVLKITGDNDIICTLNIVGENNIVTNVSTTSGNTYYGISFPGATTINGGGTLNVSNISGKGIKYVGLYSGGSMSIEQGIYNIATGENAASDSYAIQAASSLTVGAVDSLIARGNTQALKANTITITADDIAYKNYDGTGDSIESIDASNSASYKYVKVLTKIISVDITWGDLNFTAEREWQPHTHTYGCKFEPSTDTSDMIKVDNRVSTVPIKVTLAYVPIVGDILAKFLDKDTSTQYDSGYARKVNQAKECEFRLSLNGTMDTEATTVGSVTVTLSEYN